MQGVDVSTSPRNERTALIGRNIRLARKLAEMSQDDVVQAQVAVVGLDGDGDPAERLFLHTELSAWENAHRRPSDRYLERIAVITGQTVGWFSDPH